MTLTRRVCGGFIFKPDRVWVLTKYTTRVWVCVNLTRLTQPEYNNFSKNTLTILYNYNGAGAGLR